MLRRSLRIITLAAITTSCGSMTRPRVVNPRDVRLLAAHINSNQTCAVLENGELWCWGVAAFSDVHRTGEPIRIGQTTGAVELSVAQGSVCVVDDAGAVFCAGSNEQGQLGDGSDGHAELRRLDGLPPVTQLARSLGPNCALTRDRSVWCWGVEVTRSSGPLEVWSRARFSPAPMNLPERMVSIQPTTSSVCAVGESGATFCGMGVMGPARLEWRSIDALPRRGELLTSDYRVCRWDNEVITCANLANATEMPTRVSVPRAASQVRVTGDGIFAIGDNQLYFRSLLDRDTRTPNGVMPHDRAFASFLRVALDSAQSVVVGAMHACALDLEGHVWCWGDDSRSQLAQGTTIATATPSAVAGAAGVVDLFRFYATDFGGIALASSHAARGWAAATPPYEQTTAADAAPFAASTASSVDLISWPENQRYAANWGTTFITLGERGELGWHTPSSAPPRLRPFENVSPNYGNRMVVTSTTKVCRITETSDVQCVRPDAPGTPINYPGLQGSTSITVNEARLCGVLGSGSVRCAGIAPFGEPPTSDAEQLAEITELSNVRALFSGIDATCAVSDEGLVHCWGLNSGHLFGRSNREHIARPTRIEGIENARSVSIGESHACVDTTDGRVLCWGINFFSQCGASPSPMVYPPIEVQNLHDARAVFARDRQTCVSRADGSLWCWGHRFSNYGSLGAIARSRVARRVQLP